MQKREEMIYKYLHTNKQTYIHTYIHIYKHTFIHTYRQTDRRVLIYYDIASRVNEFIATQASHLFLVMRSVWKQGLMYSSDTGKQIHYFYSTEKKYTNYIYFQQLVPLFLFLSFLFSLVELFFFLI